MTGSRRTAMGSMCRTDIPPGREGFTLVEVLVSLVILSTGIVLVLGAFETSAAALARARDTIRSADLAAGKLAELRTAVRNGADLGPVQNGQFPEPFDRYRWEYRVDPESTGAFPASGITLSIYAPSDKKVPIYEVVTFLKEGS